MWTGSRVVVVVPAWEEAPRIGRVLRGIPSWVDSIVVVDDASDDGTATAAREVGDPRVEIVRHDHNRGVGAAITSGYRVALGRPGGPHDAFAVMAGDDQMHPADLSAVVNLVARGAADYVKGDRFRGPGAAASMPLARRLGGRAFSWATSKAIGIPISDSQCGYTAISQGRVRAARPGRPLAPLRLPERSAVAADRARPARRPGAGARGLRRRGEPPAAAAPAGHRGPGGQSLGAPCAPGDDSVSGLLGLRPRRERPLEDRRHVRQRVLQIEQPVEPRVVPGGSSRRRRRRAGSGSAPRRATPSSRCAARARTPLAGASRSRRAPAAPPR